MNLLPCAKPCRYQKEGNCTMEGTQPVRQVHGDCPYFCDCRDSLPLFQQQLDCLSKTGNTNQLDLGFKT